MSDRHIRALAYPGAPSCGVCPPVRTDKPLHPDGDNYLAGHAPPPFVGELHPYVIARELAEALPWSVGPGTAWGSWRPFDRWEMHLLYLRTPFRGDVRDAVPFLAGVSGRSGWPSVCGLLIRYGETYLDVLFHPPNAGLLVPVWDDDGTEFLGLTLPR